MNKIEELYATRVRPMEPDERSQLGRLILADLAHSGHAVDISDEWGDDDLVELSAFATQQTDRSDQDAKR